MPNFEARQIQKDLENGTLWPVYWLYGQERMKSRELVKRIRKAALGEKAEGGIDGFSEELLDATEVDVNRVVEAGQSLAFGGGPRLVVIREAHALKEIEQISVLFGPPGPRDQHSCICIFLSKDLDGRKKFSKTLVEKAAVVSCEEIAEEDRESWVLYLAKRRGLNLAPPIVACLRSQDPWSLDLVDRELDKLELAGEDGSECLLAGGSAASGDGFLDAFFARRKADAMKHVLFLAENPDEALPLLGLLAWNVRHLALAVKDREKGTRTLKIGAFIADRLQRWGRQWSWSEVMDLQNALAEVDFSIKQTPRLPLGIWTELVSRFCR